MPDPITPNMGLTTPVVGPNGTLAPNWALELNTDISRIDQHNHAAGNGVLITPSGLSISSDLPFIQNNATNLRSVRFTAQATPLAGVLDLGAVYVSGVDLWYNDENGNHIQITAFGGVAGSPGSIGGLTPPASVTYVSGTPAFIFQSNVNTSANLDGGSVTIRQDVANAKGITLASPNALAANYTITLPSTLPSSRSLLTIDNSGNVSTETTFFIRGTVTSAGGITSGTGFTVSHPSLGSYIVTWTTPFATAPSMMATTNQAVFGDTTVNIVNVTTTFANVTMFSTGGGGAVNCGFCFIAITEI